MAGGALAGCPGAGTFLVAGGTLAGCSGPGTFFVAEGALVACSVFWSSATGETHWPLWQIRSPLHCMSYWHPTALACGANPTAMDMARSKPSAFIPGFAPFSISIDSQSVRVALRPPCLTG